METLHYIDRCVYSAGARRAISAALKCCDPACGLPAGHESWDMTRHDFGKCRTHFIELSTFDYPVHIIHTISFIIIIPPIDIVDLDDDHNSGVFPEDSHLS